MSSFVYPVLGPVAGSGGWNAISLVRLALKECPDSVPRPSTAEFPFITDPQLRESLRMDLSEADDALANGDHKSGTVLAGALVEALLLWAIEQKPAPERITALKKLKGASVIGSKLDADPKHWQIHEYTEIALELGLIKKETAAQCRIAKGFRNLIHPGRAQRLGQACNRGTALSAIAAVELVAVDLT